MFQLGDYPEEVQLILEHVKRYPTEKNKAFVAGYAEGFKHAQEGAGIATLTASQMLALLTYVSALK